MIINTYTIEHEKKLALVTTDLHSSLYSVAMIISTFVVLKLLLNEEHQKYVKIITVINTTMFFVKKSMKKAKFSNPYLTYFIKTQIAILLSYLLLINLSPDYKLSIERISLLAATTSILPILRLL